jgi:hypothetical protein
MDNDQNCDSEPKYNTYLSVVVGKILRQDRILWQICDIVVQQNIDNQIRYNRKKIMMRAQQNNLDTRGNKFIRIILSSTFKSPKFTHSTTIQQLVSALFHHFKRLVRNQTCVANEMLELCVCAPFVPNISLRIAIQIDIETIIKNYDK